MKKHGVKIILILINVQMMTQTLIVLIKASELLNIGGIGTLMKKIKTKSIVR